MLIDPVFMVKGPTANAKRALFLFIKATIACEVRIVSCDKFLKINLRLSFLVSDPIVQLV